MSGAQSLRPPLRARHCWRVFGESSKSKRVMNPQQDELIRFAVPVSHLRPLNSGIKRSTLTTPPALSVPTFLRLPAMVVSSKAHARKEARNKSEQPFLGSYYLGKPSLHPRLIRPIGSDYRQIPQSRSDK